jgi:hypothetical protein
MQNTVYNKCTIMSTGQPFKKGTQGEFDCKPMGNVLIESTQIRWFSEQSDGRLDLERGGQSHTKPS